MLDFYPFDKRVVHVMGGKCFATLFISYQKLWCFQTNAVVHTGWDKHFCDQDNEYQQEKNIS